MTSVPVFPLNAVLFPGVVTPLHVFEDRYRALMRDLLAIADNLLARDLTLEEKREFVDLRIEGWLRALPDGLARELRREWSQLRELSRADFELDAIRRLIALEKLRGSRGA